MSDQAPDGLRDFLNGGGEMGARMRSHDWGATPLGPPQDWPQTLKTIVRLLLGTQHPMFVFWGPRLIQLYNDAYRRSLGDDRHPSALGQDGRDCWPEIWPIIGPQIELVMAGKGSTWHENALVPIMRNGRLEEVWWTYSYSPIDDPRAGSGVGGVLVICTETTERVVALQRLTIEHERFARLFDQAPTFMAVLEGPQHRFMLANPGYMRLVGERRVIGLTVVEALPEAVEQGYVALLDEVFHSGCAHAARGARFAPQRADGSDDVRYLDFVLQPIRDGAGGAVTGIFVEGFDATDRVESERAARESRERLETTLENARILALWDWNISADVFRADARMAELYGVDPPAAIAGMPVAAFIDAIVPQDRRRAAAEIAAAMHSGAPYASEHRIQPAGGEMRHVLARGRCALAADGSPQWFTGLIVDVTELRQADAALRESETRLRLVVEGAKDHAIMTTDADGVVTSFSAGAEAIYGWPAAEIVGQPVARLFTPEDLAAGVDVRELATAAHEGCANDERWHLRRDGGRVFMNGSVHPLPPDADGKPQGFLKVARDETARRGNDARRQARERLMDRLRDLDDPHEIGLAAADILARTLGTDRVGYGVTAADMATLELNVQWTAPGVAPLPTSIDLRGYGALVARLQRNELVAVADVRHDPVVLSTLAALQARGVAAFVNVPVLEHDRLVAVLFVNHGQVRPWLVEELSFIRDIAERMRMSIERARSRTALRVANETLEANVQTRTRELMAAEEALRQAQKMEAVGQLTGGIAHDFNNLLASISTSSHVVRLRLQQGKLDGVERYLSMTEDAVRRAASLTQRLLAFSRRQTLDPRPTDVNRLVAGMEDLIRRSVGPDVEVEVVGAGGLWTTRVDAPQLESALLNLCINARDAMAPGGGRLTIETANKWLDDRAADERELAPGQYISICVTDTGTGMSPEVAARIFDPFYTTKPLGQGTGLGLSMVYGFVRQSGGQVRVYSEPGHGTTMCLYLLRHVGEADAEDALPAQAPMERGFGETVLVVEDERTIRILICEVLEEAGYGVVTAEDGPAGLRVLQSEQRLDLLVTDVGLPGGMNGRQVADAGRALRPGLKVLFITGYAENAAVGNGHLERGMAVLTKPFEISVLVRKVREMLEH